MSRSDQIRDKDSIQRDAITAKIVGPVKVEIFRDNENDTWTLALMEPGTMDIKFAFVFRDLSQISSVANDINAKVVEWTLRRSKERKEK